MDDKDKNKAALSDARDKLRQKLSDATETNDIISLSSALVAVIQAITALG